MDAVSGCARFRCECCGQRYKLVKGDVRFLVNIDPFAGDLSHYIADLKELCLECGADIAIQFHAWVHPEGLIENTREDSFGVESLVAQYEFISD